MYIVVAVVVICFIGENPVVTIVNVTIGADDVIGGMVVWVPFKDSFLHDVVHFLQY